MALKAHVLRGLQPDKQISHLLLETCRKVDAAGIITTGAGTGTHGVALYEKCLELDLEGIVAKPEASPYRELKGKTTWVKVKNPDYSQAEGRRELFNSRR